MSLRGNTQSAERRRERGAAVVEMAMVAPLLIVLLLGIWTVARAYNVKNTMDHAVREGARFAATIDPWDGANSEAQVEAVIDGLLSAAAIDVNMVQKPCIDFVAQGGSSCVVGGSPTVSNAPTDLIVVRIQVEDYPLNFVFWTFEVDFASQATARHES